MSPRSDTCIIVAAYNATKSSSQTDTLFSWPSGKKEFQTARPVLKTLKMNVPNYETLSSTMSWSVCGLLRNLKALATCNWRHSMISGNQFGGFSLQATWHHIRSLQNQKNFKSHNKISGDVHLRTQISEGCNSMPVSPSGCRGGFSCEY